MATCFAQRTTGIDDSFFDFAGRGIQLRRDVNEATRSRPQMSACIWLVAYPEKISFALRWQAPVCYASRGFLVPSDATVMKCSSHHAAAFGDHVFVRIIREAVSLIPIEHSAVDDLKV